MSRRERLLLLAFYVVVLVGLGAVWPGPAVLGAVAGGVAGVLLSGRLRRLSRKVDAKIGAEVATTTGFAPRRVAVRAGTHLVVLAGLFLTTIFLPFIGGPLYAASAAAVTAVSATVTAARLRP